MNIFSRMYIILRRINKLRIITAKAAEYRQYYLDKLSWEIIKQREKNLLKYNMLSYIKMMNSFGKKVKSIPEFDQYRGQHFTIIKDDSEYTKYLELLIASWGGSYSVIRSCNSCSKDSREEVYVLGSYDETRILETKRLFEKRGIDNYIMPLNFNFFVGVYDNQYFDVFRPIDNEIIVDGGSYNGDTEVDFSNWCNGKYLKMFAFESDPDNCKNVEKTIIEAGLHDVEIVSKGMWSRNDILCFNDSETGTPGSGVNDRGTVKIPVTSIDNIVNDTNVTYIKMDIEGAELEALRGAEKTIKRCAPRLAICIYHRPEDLYEIPEYIISLDSRYRFIVRHYSTHTYETVLYASVNKEDFMNLSEI